VIGIRPQKGEMRMLLCSILISPLFLIIKHCLHKKSDFIKGFNENFMPLNVKTYSYSLCVLLAIYINAHY